MPTPCDLIEAALSAGAHSALSAQLQSDDAEERGLPLELGLDAQLERSSADMLLAQRERESSRLSPSAAGAGRDSGGPAMSGLEAARA